MKVYSADQEHIGHVAEVYEDSFLVHKGYLFPGDRYIPYSVISTVEEERVQLSLNAQQAQDALWKKRPDSENHLSDPTQLFYDRGHGVKDPYNDAPVEPPKL
jgi:hypothetical protein